MVKKIVVSVFFLIFGFGVLNSQDHNAISVYTADTSSSDVSWTCGRHYGCVMLDTGYIMVQNGAITGGEFVIDLRSLYDEDIDNELLRQTLSNVIKSKEFFDVYDYPDITFALENLIDLGHNEYNVAGQLTIKGVTRPINFNSEIIFDGDKILVYSDYFTIDRTKWGINYLSKQFDPEDKEQMHVPDEIGFLVHLKTLKKQNN